MIWIAMRLYCFSEEKKRNSQIDHWIWSRGAFPANRHGSDLEMVSLTMTFQMALRSWSVRYVDRGAEQ